MSILLFILIVLVVLALALYGLSMLPLDGTVLRIVQAVAVFLAAVVIMQRAGMI